MGHRKDLGLYPTGGGYPGGLWAEGGKDLTHCFRSFLFLLDSPPPHWIVAALQGEERHTQGPPPTATFRKYWLEDRGWGPPPFCSTSVWQTW